MISGNDRADRATTTSTSKPHDHSLPSHLGCSHSKTASNTTDRANRPTPDSAGKGQAEGGADEEIVDVLVCVRRSVFRAEAARDSEQLGVVEVGECVEVLEQCLLPLFPQVRSPKPQPKTLALLWRHLILARRIWGSGTIRF